MEKYLPDIDKSGSVSVTETAVAGGLRHPSGATGEQKYHMKNIMPTPGGIKTRRPHRRYVSVPEIGETGRGLCVHNGCLYMARGTGLYRINGADDVERVCTLANSDKTFVSYGEWLFVWPDRVYVDAAGTCYPVDAAWVDLPVNVDGTSLSATVNWQAQGIHVGDRLTIAFRSGSSGGDVYRVTGREGYTLTLDHAPDVSGDQTADVSRWVPPMEHLCTVGDRLMGCAGHTVYISEAGSPFNWRVPADLTSSAPVEIFAGGQGNFTGCTCWQGYGMFFKEDCVCKLMGSGAFGYYLSECIAPGVASDASRSLCVQGDALYYSGVNGVYRYEGSYPVPVDASVGVDPRYACGGGDGTYYYLAGTTEADMPCLYMLDTRQNAWYVADDSLAFRYMATMGHKVYAINGAGEVWQIGNDWEPTHTGVSEEELGGKIHASVTWGYESCRLPTCRRLQKISLLADARTDDETPPTLSVKIAYDEEGSWAEIGTFSGPFTHRLLDCPVIPRACDHYRLRVDMVGDCSIYRLYRTYID